MSALICGSIAYDTIMVFHDRFKEHILPDKIHILNVSFLVPELRREYGGCAGNIAYNMRLLGDVGYPMGTVGYDFAPYADWLDQSGVPQDHVQVISDTLTAQAFITTDLDDNQITAFHPGAMSFAHLNKVADADGTKIGVSAPDAPDAMISHATQFAELGTPFIFDPGQNLLLFSAEDLNHFVEQASWVAVNDYEWQLLQERTGLNEHNIVERVEALIVTRGGEGSVIYSRDGVFDIPCAKVGKISDPTGCGDAYRAGLLHGLLHDMDWETSARIASLMGAVKIEHQGTQNHQFDTGDFADRFKENFGYSYA